MHWTLCKPLLSTFIVFSMVSVLKAQSQPYGIGWHSTVLEVQDDSAVYPVFTNIWIPVSSHAENCEKSELFNYSKSPRYQTTISQLSDSNQHYYQYYHFNETLVDYAPIPWPQAQKDSVYSAIMQRTFPYQKLNPLPPLSSYPVVVYHHGSQGNPNENLELMEYFVTRGYIFISANYHLPNGNYFGLKEGVSPALTHEQAVLDWVQSLTDKNIYLAGHSWGAQKSMLLALNNPSIQGLVSLETTLEYKSDSNEIAYKWPHLYDGLVQSKGQFSMPSLLIANTINDIPFPFFEESAANTQFHVSSKDTIDHESFLSEHFERYTMHFNPSIPDSAALKSQYALYQQHIQLVFHFVDAIESGLDFNIDAYANNFYILKVN